MSTPTTFLEYREFLKQQIRKARNLKTCSSQKPSLFGSSLSQRLVNDTPVLMPEIINLMNGNNHHHQKPSSKLTKPMKNNNSPKPSSKVTTPNLSQRLQNRDYSFLISETSEAPEVAKAAPPKPAPKAEGNGTAAKKSQVSSLKRKTSSSSLKSIPKADGNRTDAKKRQVSSLKPKKSGGEDDICKSKVSESVLVSGSKSLKQRLKPKQAETSESKVKPKKEDPRLKRKVINRGRVEEDSEDDHRVDLSFMYKRGQREYGNGGYDSDDSDMVAGFDDIEKEEKRSAYIARREDLEEARRIDEEEKRERLKKAKKRKLMN